jgi:hypothetical protein
MTAKRKQELLEAAAKTMRPEFMTGRKPSSFILPTKVSARLQVTKDMRALEALGVTLQKDAEVNEVIDTADNDGISDALRDLALMHGITLK